MPGQIFACFLSMRNQFLKEQLLLLQIENPETRHRGGPRVIDYRQDALPQGSCPVAGGTVAGVQCPLQYLLVDGGCVFFQSADEGGAVRRNYESRKETENQIAGSFR